MATDLGLNGQVISEVTTDFSVSLQTTGGYEIRVEAAFSLQAPRSAVQSHVPGDPGVDKVAETFEGEQIAEAAFDDSGSLQVTFDSGRAMRVMPDEAYEAWTIAGPGGMKVVCMPGGEVASWSSQPGQERRE